MVDIYHSELGNMNKEENAMEPHVMSV